MIWEVAHYITFFLFLNHVSISECSTLQILDIFMILLHTKPT